MNTRRRFVACLASVVTASFLSTAMAQAPKTGVIKIGMNDALSGPLVFVGLPAASGVRLAVKEINDKGGFKVGDVTYKIQLIETDNRSEVASAVAGVTKLAQDDKVKYVFGPTPSGLANPTQEITVPAKVLHVSAAGSWQALGYLSDPKKPLLFGTQLPLSQIARIDMDALKQLGAKKVAYFGTDDDTTKGQIGPWLDEAKSAGISVETILFPLKTVDFSSFVSRAKGANVDAVYLLQTAVGVDLVRTVVELNAAPRGFGSRQMNPEVATKTAIGRPIPIPFFTTSTTPSYDYPPNAKVKFKARYFRAVDTKDWPLLASCFTSDCVIDFRAATESKESGFLARSPKEFVDKVKERTGGAMTVHHGHMPEIVITGDATATGIWAMFDYVATPESSPVTAHTGFGHYYEEYEKVGETWRIRKSRLERLAVLPLTPSNMREIR